LAFGVALGGGCDDPRVGEGSDGRIGGAGGNHRLVLFQSQRGVNRGRSVLLALGQGRDGVGGGGEVGEAVIADAAAADADAAVSAVFRVGNGGFFSSAGRTLFALLPRLVDDEDPDE